MTLIPILEVLQLGYNIIYIDLDVGMIIDPIPGIIQGGKNVDLTVSLEARTCFTPSVISHAKLIDWIGLEPNTGILYVRSTIQGIELYQKWIKQVINDNNMNDQKSLDFINFNAELSLECNKPLQRYANIILPIYKQQLLQRNQSLINHNISHPKYCFLNEFEYQNGKISLGCGFGTGGSLADYMNGINQQNFTIPFIQTNQTNKESNQSNKQTNQINEWKQRYYPTIVHMNYCHEKIDELK